MQKGISSTQLRANAILSSGLDVTHSGGGEDRPSSEVLNASDCSWKDGSDTAEAHSYATSDSPKTPSQKRRKQTKFQNPGSEEKADLFSGPLLPSEVASLVLISWFLAFRQIIAITIFLCPLTGRSEVF